MHYRHQIFNHLPFCYEDPTLRHIFGHPKLFWPEVFRLCPIDGEFALIC